MRWSPVVDDWLKIEDAKATPLRLEPQDKAGKIVDGGATVAKIVSR